MNRLKRLLPREPWTRFVWGVHVKTLLLFAAIVGAKWWWIAGHAGEVPYMDQWDAEAVGLYVPLQRGELSWSHIFAPHNEHRIVTARVWHLALFHLCGRQWDPFVQTVANALLHALFLSMVAHWGARRITPRWHPVVFSVIGALGILPFSWENLVWGFQAQVYFVLIFGWLAGTRLLFSRVTSPSWWWGLGSGILAVLSFGSGVLFGGALCATTFMRLIRCARLHRDDTFRLIASAALVGLAFVLRSDVPGHSHLRADSWSTFSWVFLRLMAWPDAVGLLGGLFLWAPCFVMVARVAKRLGRVCVLAETAVFAGFACAGQIGLLAVFRALEVIVNGPSSRHTDLLALGIIAGLFAVLVLFGRVRIRTWRERCIVVLWASLALLGLGCEAWGGLIRGLQPWSAGVRERRVQLTRLLAGDEIAALIGRAGPSLGYPDPARLTAILRDPSLRPVLPPALTGELSKIHFDETSGFLVAAFSADGIESMGPNVVAGWTSSVGRESRRIESRDFEIQRSHAVLPVALSHDRGQVVFELLSQDGGRSDSFVLAGSRSGGTGVVHVDVHLSPGRYLLRIRDRREQGWVAVSPPQSMSPLGYWSRKAAGNAGWLFAPAWLGFGLAFAFVPGGARRRSAGFVDDSAK